MTVKPEHLGGDRYRVRIYAGIDPATNKGRQISRSFRAPNQRAANRAAAEHETALRAQVDEVQAEKGTVAELVKAWQSQRTDRTRSPATIYRERSICRRIIEQLGPIPLEDLTPRHVDEWYGWLRTINPERPLSEATVNHHHRVLSSILRRGVNWRMSTGAATDQADRPKAQKHHQRPPTRDQLRALLTDVPTGLIVPISVLASTGVRRGELLGLKWTDVLWDQQRIEVARSVVEVPGRPLVDKVPKSGLTRIVWVQPGLVAILDRWHRDLVKASPELVDDARVFPNLKDDRTGQTPMRPGWLSLAWRRHCAKHGVHVRLHDLRHYYASEMLNQGVAMAAVQEQLGHAKLSTTLDIYGSRTSDSEAAARIALDGLLP